jgi:hypothetical protein
MPNLRLPRSRAFSRSIARSRGDADVISDSSSFFEADVISSIAVSKAPALAADGLLKPLTFLTN